VTATTGAVKNIDVKTFLKIKNVGKIKNVNKRKKRALNKKRKKSFFTSMVKKRQKMNK